MSESLRVPPRARAIGRRQQHVAALQHDLRELQAAHHTDRQHLQQLLADTPQLEHTLAASNRSLTQCTDTLEGWTRQKAEGHKAVNIYSTHWRILADVRHLESRTAHIDANLHRKQYAQRASDTWQLQSDALQARLRDLQHSLTCPPPSHGTRSEWPHVTLAPGHLAWYNPSHHSLFAGEVNTD